MPETASYSDVEESLIEGLAQPATIEADCGGGNLFLNHRGLRETVLCHAPKLNLGRLQILGAKLASAELRLHAQRVSTHLPHLRKQDRVSSEAICFHPSYQHLLEVAFAHGLHAAPWSGGFSHLERAAGFMLFAELETSALNPVSMHYAALALLQAQCPELFADWRTGLLDRRCDLRHLPAQEKAGLRLGIGAIGSRTLFAESECNRLRYKVQGCQWLPVAPSCDAHLLLAQTGEGPTCLFLPRWLPNADAVNAVSVRRVRYGCGDPASASIELECQGAQAWAIGPAGDGLRQFGRMMAFIRLDVALSTAALMHRSMHCLAAQSGGEHRGDLALECEAAMALSLRLAHVMDAATDEHEAALGRMLAPLVTLWLSKRGRIFGQQALELQGRGGMALRSCWGLPMSAGPQSPNPADAADLLLALREAPVRKALTVEFERIRGADSRLDLLCASLLVKLEKLDDVQTNRLADELALALQAVQLYRHSEHFNDFCDARLGRFGCSSPSRPLAIGS